MLLAESLETLAEKVRILFANKAVVLVVGALVGSHKVREVFAQKRHEDFLRASTKIQRISGDEARVRLFRGGDHSVKVGL